MRNEWTLLSKRFEQVRGHELTHTRFSAPDGQAFDFVIVEVLAHARFEHELGRGVQREGEPFQLVVDLVVRRAVAFRGQRRADGLRAETSGKPPIASIS